MPEPIIVTILFCLTVLCLMLVVINVKQKLAHQQALDQLKQNHTYELRLKDAHIENLENLSRKSEESFKALSAEALRKNNELFLQIAKSSFNEYRVGAEKTFESNQKTVEQLVVPLIESLKKVDDKISDLEKTRVGAYEGIRQQLENMARLNQKLEKETTHLAKALRTPAAKGMWGELQLKRVVEMAGMVEHCDFNSQVHIKDEASNTSIRPDMVVELPGQKQIVVDAKVPITHYLSSLEASDDEHRQRLATAYVKDLKKHIQILSQKNYWDQFENAPEFVVLFLPGEVFFSAALQHDPELIEHGIQQKVILATPTTLIALLKAVAYGWQQENMTRNARKISQMSQLLIKRLSDFSLHFKDIGRFMGQTVGAYNRAVGSFDSRVIATAKKVTDLGVGATADLPDLTAIEAVPKSLKFDPSDLEMES